MPAIEVRNLTVHFGDFCAVNDISFDVDMGEVVTLLGPNGAGKTTTIETVEGFREPGAGTVRVLGLDPVTDHSRLMDALGVMLQGLGIYPQLPPLRALRLFGAYYENPRDPSELLETVNLTHVAKTPAKRLSGGERQRLALALCLVGRPKVVLLDEPTSGIDPAGRIKVRSIISGLRDEGVAIILTTHELDEAERLADRVIIISEGSIVSSGSIQDLTRTSNAVRFQTTTPIDREMLTRELNIMVEICGSLSYRVLTDDPSRVIAPLTAWLATNHHEILNLRSGGDSLEEIYLAVTQPQLNDQRVRTSRISRTRSSRRARGG
ncbi:MAG TPA: ABC transporter ATP-binding protein [Acidimicrobiales bacterium]|nr:ABC transporter ATP-binding protein [Acidimicrobiales bacterium]